MRRLALVSGVSTLSFLAAAITLAQGTPPRDRPGEDAVGDSANAKREEVIVTARRREERLQDVPIAVTAIGGEDLQDKAIARLDDLARNVPALQMQPGAFSKNIVSYTIRSQRQPDPILTQENSVGVYFADVVLSRPHGANAALFDIASVQVLKGPQGTLFGRNTTGGAIVITPQAPTDDFGGYARATVGNYEQRVLEGAVNLPLNEALQVRVAGQLNRRDGYVHNLFDGRDYEDEHTDSWRVSVLFAPSDVFENRLVVSGFEANEHGSATRMIGAAPPATLLVPGIGATLADLSTRDFYTVSNNNRLSDGDNTEISTWLASNISELHLGSVTLKNIIGYRDLESNVRADVDASPVFFFEANDVIDADQVSDELQVFGTTFDGDLDYILGAFYFEEDGRQTLTNAPLGLLRSNIGDVTNTSTSVFAQATYRLPFASAVSLTGGVRQNWDKREVTLHNTVGQPPVCSLLDAGGARLDPCSRALQKDFDQLTYTASLDWKVSDDVLLYLAHRKGYRSGGFNLRALTPQQAASYEPETVDDIELGAKADWALGNVNGRVALAAYQQKYDDIQRNVDAIVNGQFIGATIVNAASATIEGFEAELTISPARWLDFSVFYSYSDARFDRFIIPTATGGTRDVSNSPFSGSPRDSGGASATFRHDLATGGDVQATLSVYSQSKTYVQEGIVSPVTLKPFPTSELPSYTIANARGEWNRILGSGVSAAAYINNMFEEEYFRSGTDLISLGLGINGRALGAPRTYGVELYVTF